MICVGGAMVPDVVITVAGGSITDPLARFPAVLKGTGLT